ncbi:type Z 30S ribosomal protein S14 [Candidatus Poribacteria bacterium]|nr:type Z 30S ribosomal protein S14 [Candidatus Poribacteria bacterium]MDP6748823.1 type Z 30S ribosomal protein S14 [Candidatus Poribacteria bacterium]MDP6961219.1 type Z 30S ribosomal protein S14 [Dehalococcoidia bacterium]
MSTKALVAKQKRKPKFSTRRYNRCGSCGRARGFLQKFGLCRICFRLFARAGQIPGVRKASW